MLCLCHSFASVLDCSNQPRAASLHEFFILHEMVPRPFVENTAWCILVEKVLGYDLQVLNT